MEDPISGRLRWDTAKAAIPGWLLFLDGRPGDAPTMLSVYETNTPHNASRSELADLIADMLQRETGQRPRQVQVTQVEEGPVYYFVATDEDPV